MIDKLDKDNITFPEIHSSEAGVSFKDILGNINKKDKKDNTDIK